MVKFVIGFLLLAGCSGDPCSDIPFGIGHPECLNPPPNCYTGQGTGLLGSDDCDGLTLALDRCMSALQRVPEFADRTDLTMPQIVQVDPGYLAATAGTSAGTANHNEGAVLVLDANWTGDNAFCHETIHLNLYPEHGHEDWTTRGFYRAIDEAAWRNP